MIIADRRGRPEVRAGREGPHRDMEIRCCRTLGRLRDTRLSCTEWLLRVQIYCFSYNWDARLA